jgi:hypothetical protein
MPAVATVWAAPPAQSAEWEGRANPNLASCGPRRTQTAWREIRKGWAEITKKLGEFLSLEDDWDGGGAKKPDPEIIRFCTVFANGLADLSTTPASSVSPTVEGGVVFQWQSEAARLEFEINEPFRVECMLSVRGQKPKHRVLS